MKTLPNQIAESEDIEDVPMLLPLDPATIAWLARLHRVTGDHPREIIASMLRQIRVDDEASHDEDRRGAPARKLH